MRLPNTAFTEHPWRIHEFIEDFEVEDVWYLDTPGGPDDLAVLVRQSSGDGTAAEKSFMYRLLFAIRWKLGVLFKWDGEENGVGPGNPSLRDRLPGDLREGPRGPDLRTVPMKSVYQASDEWVTEVVNKTVHAVMHIGWVADGEGGYHGQMAVLVKKKGLLGKVYMPLILPFRRVFVTPNLVKSIGTAWRARPAG
ncbi:DUF2867 domain-containing protein [Streptomyces sp. WAC 01529]|uniref:DUF2867 domain-containing protein n=1 Tax=Streptomyces sp. WAC 01529 TaxID=2203205 RepID=UPI000F6F86A3|nr:DUF2867 domain-containing protein [Streptomyces sp. WAC 01529]AZM55235.1 DUF2867 domain-containing protein [Streptomyces sp. WAC 01529]